MIGRVTSAKLIKTVTVLVETPKKHPLYGKLFTRTKRYLVDDPIGVTEGDLVEVIKIKPTSKNKHWQIVKVLGKDLIALGEQAMKEVAKDSIEEVLPEKEELKKDQESLEEDQGPKKQSKKKGENPT